LVYTAVGQYEDAIDRGRRSIELGKRDLNQPELVTAYVNIGDAYLLIGDQERAAESLEGAKEWLSTHDDWYMTVIFLFENASRALATGNVGLALNIRQEIDRMTGGSQQLHVQGGLTAKLDVVKAFHERDLESAYELALERTRYFEKRAPYYYLDALATCAWLEKKRNGKYSDETSEQLKCFELWGAMGKKALLQAQGFLS
jgi:tetratricopeptide (TPR) repeat protein